MLRAWAGCFLARACLASLSRGLAQEMHTPPPAQAVSVPPVETWCGREGSAAFDFSNVPPVPRPPDRLGMFAVPPAGPGYYSALDWLSGTYRESAPPGNFPPFGLSGMSFFDYDWRYLDDPSYDPDLRESLKRIHIGDNWLASTGGEVRYRYQDEYHSRLTAFDNSYSLTRVRAYTDIWYQDRFRLYDNANHVVQTGLVRDPATIHTIGRYCGDINNRFLWDSEGAIQLGEVVGRDVLAGMYFTRDGWMPSAGRTTMR